MFTITFFLHSWVFKSFNRNPLCHFFVCCYSIQPDSWRKKSAKTLAYQWYVHLSAATRWPSDWALSEPVVTSMLDSTSHLTANQANLPHQPLSRPQVPIINVIEWRWLSVPSSAWTFESRWSQGNSACQIGHILIGHKLDAFVIPLIPFDTF